MPDVAVADTPFAFESQADSAFARARAGDAAAFGDLVQARQAMVFGLAYHFIRDRSLAEELSQEVFLDLYRNLQRLESDSHVLYWLRRVTTHRCIDAHRRLVRRKEVAVETLPDVAAPSHAPDFLREERLRRLVADLPAAARAVVVLRYQEDLDPSEIAKILDMRVNTVKSHLHRSIIALRTRLAEEEVRP